MISQFNQLSPDEAKKEGEEWFRSVRKEEGVKSPLAKTEKSNNEKRLRVKNERILRRAVFNDK
ncbi:hypothetical protein X953_01710 [Virgibacillus sp. SK37]|nr:hypothetical protein X953_01710 [Virgibacillus sp. SK37]